MVTMMHVSSENPGLSKAEILRGIVTEKLTTAAQEIWAVVERTVAGYEEEASGFRKEIARQKRQLEVLLQPQVKLCRIDSDGDGLFPSCDLKEEEADGGLQGKYKEDPAQSASLDQEHLWASTRIAEGRKPDDGLTESKTDLLSSSRKKKRSDKRTFLPSPGSEGEAKDDGDDDWRPAVGDKPQKKKKKRFNIEKRQSPKLRVCLLEDCHIDVLSKNVFKKFPLQELHCPQGLQEVDFLNLLRSTFPQLAPKKPFDVFITDTSRKLQPLKVETLTPEEICRSIRSTGHSALYIRLKAADELQVSRQSDLSHREDDAESPSASIVTGDETRKLPSSFIQHREDGVLSCSSASQQEAVEAEGADDDEDAGLSEPTGQAPDSAVGSDGDEEEETKDRDDDWKPDRTGEELEGSDENTSETTRERGRKRERKRERKRIQSSAKVLKKQSDAVVSCKVCGFLYKSKNVLIKHASSHADDPERLCGVCGERSESTEELRSHLETHLKTHTCNTCGKSFITVTTLMEHMAGHMGQKTHKCDVCNKSFFFKRKLESHQKFHQAGKYTCHVCHRVFRFEVQLKLHSRMHTGEKPYRCTVCGKSLANLRVLSLHTLSHSTGEKRYGCQVCGKHFRLEKSLNAHKKIHTVRQKSYLCDVCCKAFYTNGMLKAHMRIHNTKTREGLHTCTKCGKTLSCKFSLKKHMRTHSDDRPHACLQCGLAFKRKSNLKAHLNLHSGNKPFVCRVCGKACARQEYLTVHMRTHNGERPYQCTLCDKAFTQSHCLKTHMKSHQGVG